MCSIILGLGLMGVEEIIIGDAVYIDIPQSSTGVYDELATEVVPYSPKQHQRVLLVNCI